MDDINQNFFDSYLALYPRKIVYTEDFPLQMKASDMDSEGWIVWKRINGTLQESDYKKLEEEFGVLFPRSFIDWHRSHFFLDADCSIIRLPSSSPTRPLEHLKQTVSWFIPEQLIPKKLYPFGDEGNDTGPLVFDGRELAPDSEFPIHVYDNSYGGDLDGLTEVIFSSFSKLLECLTHYLTELKTRKNYEIIPDFFQIDPVGAGKTGVEYWRGSVEMQKANFEAFGY